MIKKLKRWVVLRVLRGSGPRARVREVEVMAGLSVPENHPVLVAVMTLLQERIDQAGEQVSSPELALHPEAVIHTAGGLEWLREFGLYLEQMREMAVEKTGEG